MNPIKRFVLKLLMRILDSSLEVDYKKIDRKAVDRWAFMSFSDVGFRSYFAYEDLKILKELSFGKDRDTYFILIGRRLQLLNIFDEMRKAFENKKSESEKKRSQQAGSEGNNN